MQQHQYSDASASENDEEEEDDEEAYHAQPRPKVREVTTDEGAQDDLHVTAEAAADPALDEDDGEPYFNEEEYEPVSPKMHSSAKLDLPEAGHDLVIPDPPPVESAIQQDPALTAPSVDSAAALQKALNAWYTAGYAAALYHVKAGMVQP